MGYGTNLAYLKQIVGDGDPHDWRTPKRINAFQYRLRLAVSESLHPRADAAHHALLPHSRMPGSIYEFMRIIPMPPSALMRHPIRRSHDPPVTAATLSDHPRTRAVNINPSPNLHHSDRHAWVKRYARRWRLGFPRLPRDWRVHSDVSTASFESALRRRPPRPFGGAH